MELRGQHAGEAVNWATGDDLETGGAAQESGLRWGDPQAFMAMRPDDVVLDIDSGAGFDSMLAARRVGRNGQVIGVDASPEMVARARDNARRAKATVEFRVGDIEHLPLPDASVDAVITNSVIIPSGDKLAVFRELHRVLKPGGRIVLTDLIASGPLPTGVIHAVRGLSSHVGVPVKADDIRRLMVDLGFEAVHIEPREDDLAIIGRYLPGAEEYLAAMRIQGRKPAGGRCCPPSCCE